MVATIDRGRMGRHLMAGQAVRCNCEENGTIESAAFKCHCGIGASGYVGYRRCGLPIPPETTRIDLAVAQGVPPFLPAVAAVLGEMQVDSAIVASEMLTHSPGLRTALLKALGDIRITEVPHEQFKAQTCDATAVVRTGEFTPYANVILVAGVVF